MYTAQTHPQRHRPLMRSRFCQTVLLAFAILAFGYFFVLKPLSETNSASSKPAPYYTPQISTDIPVVDFQTSPAAEHHASDTPAAPLASDLPSKNKPGADGIGNSAEGSESQYVLAIMDPHNTRFQRMQCPVLDAGALRYESLRKPAADNKPRYLIALNLYQVEQLLPRLMGSVVEAIRFLGPNNCAVSIVEGRSSDSTYSILQKLKSEVEQLGSSFFLLQSDLDPKADGVDRIKALGELRNLALEPIVKHPSDFSASPIVVFINDIALCAEDILELLIQHTEQGASMTCGMDWIHDGEAFYDVWISRTINSGNTFFEVPQDADWKYKDNLFFDDPLTKQRFGALKPFEVYACWGGMVTLDARIFVAQRIKFRSSDSDECYMGEPTLLGKDLWKERPGKIATIPVVNNGYSNDEGGKIKKRRGYVSELVDVTQPFNSSELITWSKKPPPMVKCISMMWNDPHWVTPV